MAPVDPEDRTTESSLPADDADGGLGSSHAQPNETEPLETRILLGILLGPKGLRAGWSIALFAGVYFLLTALVGLDLP